ncbi:Magnesium-dependent phosphatase [Fasciola hepatica]|uniref:Magnesium-dependent phosphatase n=1 Tax=Fasciola hepatica TaxID=6192 RepID=A0A4E0S2L9_FASHE|nr:Magnesium-dependent phosphatase [Fasciola hepatica]
MLILWLLGFHRNSLNTDQLVLTTLSTAKASNMLQNFKVLPKLIVFDLGESHVSVWLLYAALRCDIDYTLWPFWCDTHIYPPIHKRDDTLYNADGTKINIYPDSELILKCIHSNPGVKLACASRTGEIDIAKQLLNLLGWDELFDYVVIFPGSKVMHFERLHKRTGIPYNQMVFFDDEHRNVSEVSRLGVHTHLVDHGVSLGTFKFALQQFETVSN